MASKRGRKRKNDLYFGPDEEKAVVEFLACDDSIERNKIYNEWLRAPFDKMIESIIRRYKLYRKAYSFEDLHSDTLSFLITKADKFDHTQNNRAYSYYGTICKNYILMLLIKDDKGIKTNASFEDTFESIQHREDLTYYLTDTDYGLTEFIQTISEEIKSELACIDEPKKKITENERKVGEALIEILENYSGIFENMEGGSKYNKNIVLATIRDYTNLSTKDIRVAMRRFKKLYYLIKDDKTDEGYL